MKALANERNSSAVAARINRLEGKTAADQRKSASK